MARPLGVALKRLRLQVVREVRQVLGAVLGDEHEVLEPDAAEALPVETGLERDHVAGDELLFADQAHARLLVHLEANAVPEAVVEAFVEHLSLLLSALRRQSLRLEDLAADLVNGLAVDA